MSFYQKHAHLNYILATEFTNKNVMNSQLYVIYFLIGTVLIDTTNPCFCFLTVHMHKEHVYNTFKLYNFMLISITDSL